MYPSRITISEESIISLAKNSIRSIKCEWTLTRSTCNAHLASVYLFEQHVLRHCRLQAGLGLKQKHDYACSLPKCSARFHPSLDALESHVVKTHLARAQLPCPVKDCSLAFHRQNSLRDHFRDHHQVLNDRVLQLPSNLLHPLWTPFIPRITSPPPLPLILPASSLLPPLTFHGTSPNISESSDSTASPQVHQLRKEPIRPIDTPGTLDLAPLSTSSFKDIAIRNKSQALMKDVSRPQTMCTCSDHENDPPPSILFDVFARRLEQLEKDKILSTNQGR